MSLQLAFPHQWNRAAQSRSVLSLGPDEAVTQDAILILLRSKRIEAEAIDAGGKKIRGVVAAVLRSMKVPQATIAIVQARMKGAAPTSWPDITGILPGGRALFIEVKAPERVDLLTGRQLRAPGKAEPEQLVMLDRLHQRGALVGVCWSMEDARRLLASVGL